MKKVFIFMTMAVLTLTLVACVGGSKITFDDWNSLKTMEYDGSAVTVQFWHRAGEQNQQMFQKWIGEFNEIYPNITVLESKEADDYDGLVERVSLTITTGRNPDIVESYPDHVARYGEHALELNYFVENKVVNSHIKDEEGNPTGQVYGWTQAQIDDFLEGLWLEGQSYDNEGTIKSLPFTKSSEALYYNAVKMEQYGINDKVAANGGFLTWEDIFDMAAAIKADEPESYPFGYDSSDNFFITASEQWDAPYTGYDSKGRGEVLFNNAESKVMIKYFKDKIDQGLMTTRALSGSYASDNMKKGEAPYMFVGSTGGARYSVQGVTEGVFDGGNGYRVGVLPVPVKDTTNRKQIQQGPNISLFKKNDPQQMLAAWLFSQFMLEAERTAEFALQSGYAPVRHSAYETTVWTNYVAGINQTPTTIAQATDKAIYDSIMMFRNNESIFFTSAVFSKSSATRGEVGQLLNTIFASTATGAALDTLIDNEYQDAYDFITS